MLRAMWGNLSAWTRRVAIMALCALAMTLIICLAVTGELGAIIRVLVGKNG